MVWAGAAKLRAAGVSGCWRLAREHVGMWWADGVGTRVDAVPSGPPLISPIA